MAAGPPPSGCDGRDRPRRAAIEIVDSRIADWKITFADTVADNGSSAFFVLGQGPQIRSAGLDLWTCGMALEVNGKSRPLGRAPPASAIR
jgi:2-keto-4-pentenoate hydratase